MIIKNLNIYPVKGLKGINVQSAKLTNRGFEHDRRWMLIDKNGYFLSQRSHKQLATYHTSLDQSNGNITIEKDSKSLSISTIDATNEIIEVGMFDHLFPAHLAKNHINEWWSDQLGQDVRMVHLHSSDIRIKNYIGEGDSTEMSMADGYPYLILGTASLHHLNNKLDTPITIDRFRANIIIETSEPHIEDTWKYIQIGNEKMYLIKKCTRCQVIAINQSNGESSSEPTKTLATYRKENKKINFGVNAIAISCGDLSTGDKISIL